jgi:hypothetical protein
MRAPVREIQRGERCVIKNFWAPLAKKSRSAMIEGFSEKTEGARVGAGNVFTGVFRTFFSCRVFCFLNF